MSTVTLSEIGLLCRRLKRQGKKIVLTGGCFDVLHPGHVVFLEKAKKQGDVLLVMLESDARVKCLKGINRPVHNQKQRAQVLGALKSVDYILMLPNMKNETDYDKLTARVKPDVIAATAGDVNNVYRKRAARLSGAVFKVVTKVVGNHSTSALLKRD
ncbi:adenylyltransferase/cytidyltransferase family protein [Candidatus Daviesbacteria bacterium]|nr:adenylyltransferase/cytidyltransferase family protein [Candidatus Daviesbacteria bacterium]